MTRRVSWDELAVDAMFGPAPARELAWLAAKAREISEARAQCPRCEHRGPHLENETTTLCCSDCGTHFDRENEDGSV